MYTEFYGLIVTAFRISEMWKMESKYPNIKNGIKKLHISETLSPTQMQSIIYFIDDICTCNRFHNSSKIVESVNWHNHSKSCRKKKNKQCLFNFQNFHVTVLL